MQPYISLSFKPACHTHARALVVAPTINYLLSATGFVAAEFV